MNAELDQSLRSYLEKRQVLEASELDVALSVAVKRGESLARALQRMELLDPDVLQQHAAEALGFPLVDLDTRVLDDQLMLQLGESFCSKYKLLVLHGASSGPLIDIVLANPSNIVAVDALRQRMGGRAIRLCMADQSAIERAQHLFFQDKSEQRYESNDSDAVAVLLGLLNSAVSQSASDVHLEPTGDCARVRLRCDGVLRLWRHLNFEQWQLLLGRIKVLSGLDIADCRRAQDGRFSHSANGREIDIRVSVLPTDRGEAVVLRILDRNRHALNFESLGVDRDQTVQLLEMLKRPEGMLLVCGPTGSGKSTTLYALVESLRGQSLNIITLEDPVEYPATWVRQTSINDAVAIDYAEGVRAALRQDPDVMLIGEMRDQDTAQMALRAAMTGHRVLSTVHANSALASVGRLWDLGLQPELVAGNITGVVAQRLLRKLCQNCIKKDLKNPGCLISEGCEKCAHRGYIGRLPVLEIWPVDSDFDELLHQGSSRGSLERLALEKGMYSLKHAASDLMRAGLTSADEVIRVVGPLPQLGAL